MLKYTLGDGDKEKVRPAALTAAKFSVCTKYTLYYVLYRYLICVTVGCLPTWECVYTLCCAGGLRVDQEHEEHPDQEHRRCVAWRHLLVAARLRCSFRRLER